MSKGYNTLGSYIVGDLNGNKIQMIIDSGCSRTLVHEKLVEQNSFTGEFISVITANSDRVEVPLAWVIIHSEQGVYRELVGVMKNLPVDCLLGRSSYGKTLAKKNLLHHWEQAVDLNTDLKGACSDTNKSAFVTTRRGAALVEAQNRLDKLIDKQNELVIKTLSPKKSVKDNTHETIEVSNLFGESDNAIAETERKEACVKESVVDINSCENSGQLGTNILDRSSSQLISDQKKDVTLHNLTILNVPPEDIDGYFYANGIVMHRKFTKHPHDGLPYIDRVVAPEAYRPEILRLGHSIPLAGHMGQEKTYERISRHFTWPRLYTEVKDYCATCPQCQIVARKSIMYRAPLNPVPVVFKPFKKIAIDLIGELPKTKTGYKYILTVIDYATRYPEAIPLKTTHSRVIAEALISVFSRVGLPNEIVSDQGSNLIGQLMTQLYELLGISHIKTSVYHPEANGLVERFNGTLKHMLKKFVENQIDNWDKYLPYVLFAYREVPCQSTGYSPFELLYGRSIRGPFSLIKETWVGKDSLPKDVLSCVLEARTTFESNAKYCS